ncbi:phage tail tape measure protein [Parasulfitobacter algicola]|uniref:Phage tail tape measure protein n=1 Tax=Parasulfitobacter algicola TaxID=2614809 RepID=A0ABX2IUM3_9RHOB|nr:phage tail tape measure protein [Sulfitobacter algicola]NSX56250.1 phage tail tape measure protein [Sulfitobacter algicola]
MKELEGLDTLDDQVSALERTLGGASGVAAAFDTELVRMRNTLGATGREVDSLSTGMSKGLRRAFDGVVFDGMKLSDALDTIAKSMVDTAYSAAIRPVTNHVSNLVGSGVGSLMQGLMPFEKGGAFSQGKVTPFAKGGVLSGPTTFPMRGGMGLMGEAGPEAIMPLSRGPDGRLGVKTDGGGRPTTIVMNISTPDVEGFRRSQSQISTQMNRALSRGQRNR